VDPVLVEFGDTSEQGVEALCSNGYVDQMLQQHAVSFV